MKQFNQIFIENWGKFWMCYSFHRSVLQWCKSGDNTTSPSFKKFIYFGLGIDRRSGYKMLDYLYLQSGVVYLSDLKGVITNPKIQKEILDIDAERFPMAEWDEAVSYIFNKRLSFRSVEEAKAYVRKRCML